MARALIRALRPYGNDSTSVGDAASRATPTRLLRRAGTPATQAPDRVRLPSVVRRVQGPQHLLPLAGRATALPRRVQRLQVGATETEAPAPLLLTGVRAAPGRRPAPA